MAAHAAGTVCASVRLWRCTSCAGSGPLPRWGGSRHDGPFRAGRPAVRLMQGARRRSYRPARRRARSAPSGAALHSPTQCSAPACCSAWPGVRTAWSLRLCCDGPSTTRGRHPAPRSERRTRENLQPFWGNPLRAPPCSPPSTRPMASSRARPSARRSGASGASAGAASRSTCAGQARPSRPGGVASAAEPPQPPAQVYWCSRPPQIRYCAGSSQRPRRAARRPLTRRHVEARRRRARALSVSSALTVTNNIIICE